MSNFRRVIVDTAKLRDYCLSPSHPRGRHKARVFRSRLGLEEADAQALRRALGRAVRDRSHDMRLGNRDKHGQRYVLDFEMTTSVGTAIIRSSWIAPNGDAVLRFVTCYVL